MIATATVKKIFAFGLTAALAGGMLAGCSSSQQPSSSDTSSDESAAEVENVQMQYISPEDTEANLDNDDYLVVDVRKTADYETAHIPGAVSADVDAAAKGGDYDTATENMVAAMQEATGTDNGEGKNLVLVCYTGNSYAQAATNILSELGADMDTVYTLEGGMKAWTGETE